MVRGSYVLNGGQVVARSYVMKKERCLQDSIMDVSVKEDQSDNVTNMTNINVICDCKFCRLSIKATCWR